MIDPYFKPFFTFSIALAHGQILEIQNFDKDQNMIALKIGRARTIESYLNFIHIIDLDSYNSQTSKLIDIVDKFEKKPFKRRC